MAELKKNDIITCRIDDYTTEGSGVAHFDGHVIFIKNAIAGETCTVKILKAGKNISYGKAEDIVSPSPERAAPPCPNFPKCGGCKLMHMTYDEELRFKRGKVNAAFKRIGGLDLEVDGITGSDSCLNYRNKAIYAVSRENGRAVTGFFRERTHDVIPAEKCLIQSDYSDRAASAVRWWLDQYSVPHYNEKSCTGNVRHIFCRCGAKSGEGQVVVVTFKNELPHKAALINKILELCPETVSIVHNINANPGNTVLDGRFNTIWGSGGISDTLCGLDFKLSPRSFYQVNSHQAERLYEKAIEYASLTPEDTALDLYCGTGTITLCLAKHAKLAIGAEIVPEAIMDAGKNAGANGIKNAEFICADARDAASRLAHDGVRPDVVVLDPPRKGLSPAVIETVAGMSPKRVVYVSCDPATLARDLKIFSGLGYAPKKAHAFDLFPRTHHVEVVCLLSKQNGD